jgi:hypothetical protein
MEISKKDNKEKKPYFVSYFYWKKDAQGISCNQLDIEGPVSGWDNVLAIISEIRRLNPEFIEVAVLNWRRFEDPE